MTTGGWITMIVSVGSVTVFFIWTLYRVFTAAPPDNDLHSIREEPPDVNE
jgi:hypothetical protein